MTAWWGWIGVGRGCLQVDPADYSSIPQQRQSRPGGEEKRQSEWAELGYLICVYVLNGYGDEEQCFHSHWYFWAKVTL